jgi:hypothetical protein
MANLTWESAALGPVSYGLVVLVGSILLGAMTIRARILPWWCGVLLIVGFLIGDILEMVVVVGSENIVFAIVWGLIGSALLLQEARQRSNLHARAELPRIRLLGRS